MSAKVATSDGLVVVAGQKPRDCSLILEVGEALDLASSLVAAAVAASEAA